MQVLPGCEESTVPGTTFEPVEAGVQLPRPPAEAAAPDASDSSVEAVAPACNKVFYLLSAIGQLSTFDPVTLASAPIGKVDCLGNDPDDDEPYSMTIDAKGTGWVSRRFKHDLLTFNLTTLACQPTSFAAGQQGWAGPMKLAFRGQELFVLDSGRAVTAIVPSKGLAKVDLTTFALTPVAGLSGAFAGKEGPIAFTPKGDLYGLFLAEANTDLVRIDPSNGQTSAPIRLATGWRNVDAPIVALDDDVWLFSTEDADGGVGPLPQQKTVRRYNVTSGQLSIVKVLDGFVVAAGLACAPSAADAGDK